jgi:hypothetical protein
MPTPPPLSHMPFKLQNDADNIIINNSDLYISPRAWKEINASYTKEEIKEAISNGIDEYQIPVPKDIITLEEAKQDFQKLKELDVTKLFKSGKTFTRYEYQHMLSDLYIDSCNIGNKSSNYFHQDSRYLCDSINSPSPHRSWYIKKFRYTLLNCLWTLKFEHVDLKILRTALHLRKYVASQFRPSAAKAVYQNKNSKTVLDFSMGWGDRLNGFLSCEETAIYFGIDPNRSLYEGYGKQIDTFNTGKKVIIYDQPAEEVDIPKDTFDTVFTSPPYFNIERYTQEDNQSWKRYKKLDDWLRGFLFPVLEKSWHGLKSGGSMVINISDVYSNHTINKICDPMNEFISKLPNAHYMGTIGLRMAKRPNSRAVGQDGIFTEPMWSWRKNR